MGTVGEITAPRALRELQFEMRLDPGGRRVLAERPCLLSTLRRGHDEGAEGDAHLRENMAALLALPEGTFGREFAKYMDGHGFDPVERPKVELLGGEGAYLMHRYRQCHDFWHALTGLPPTVAGEGTTITPTITNHDHHHDHKHDAQSRSW